MNTIGNIKIKGKDYKYSFKMKSRRLFMEALGLKYLSEYDDRVKSIQPDENNEVTMDGLFTFGNLLLTGIQAETNERLPFDADDLLDEFVNDPSLMSKVVQFFVKNQELKKASKIPDGRGKSKKGE
ncbi:hypothetical protein [Aquimarina sp. 2201CG14-23]|uniref:hypothetical protein n=1 Tax=Aquimarina mycalae TaxID=3040073 RepID=UPI0024780FF4|nr:hypothetical protein [Aquimarina sp. 2201CG14-23]MDH7444678.1 hypothetical protein [Aquimarina sp. 2201CG14-23]